MTSPRLTPIRMHSFSGSGKPSFRAAKAPWICTEVRIAGIAQYRAVRRLDGRRRHIQHCHDPDMGAFLVHGRQPTVTGDISIEYGSELASDGHGRRLLRQAYAKRTGAQTE